jgi:hypothetical protein
MSEDEAWGMALPPFKVDEALQKLRRSLRDVGLAERSGGFELKGRRMVELEAAPAELGARLARRPALTPEWDRFTLRSAADVRKFQDELTRRLRRWQEDDA